MHNLTLQYQLQARLQRGSALLSALFIMTLIAISATVMMSHLSMNIAQTERFIRRDELYLASQMVPFWAMTQLRSSTTKFIPVNKKMAVLVFPSALKNQYPGIELYGEIFDLQSQFNLNDLTQPNGAKTFNTLISKINPSINSNLLKMITQATKDWISPTDGVNQDKWQQYYSSMNPPYQSAHQLMISPSEFKLVAGVTPDIFESLQAYYTTLPETVPVNINTASQALLEAVNQKLSNTQIEELIQLRNSTPILTQESFNKLSEQFPLSAGALTFQSRYFLCITTARRANQSIAVITLLKRSQLANKTWQAQIVRQSFNNW